MIRHWLILLFGSVYFIYGCGASGQPLPTVPVPPVTATASVPVQPARAPDVPLDLPELDAAAEPRIAVTSVPQPTVLAGDPMRVVIDAIDLDQPLVPVGLDTERVPIVPKHDIGWYFYSALPGAGENVVLWGHVLRFRDAPEIPAPFARLHELQPGATIALHNEAGQVFTYRVAEQLWVTPDQVNFILPQGREQLTLVSCIGDKIVVDNTVDMSHRLITIALPE